MVGGRIEACIHRTIPLDHTPEVVGCWETPSKSANTLRRVPIPRSEKLLMPIFEDKRYVGEYRVGVVFRVVTSREVKLAGGDRLN